MTDIADHVVMITGASGNLGSALGKNCIDLGANVILIDQRIEALQSKFGNQNDDAVYLAAPVDVTDQKSMDNLAMEILNKYGRIDALINTVGAFRADNPLHKTTDELWDFIFKVNVKSVVVSSRAVIPQMINQGSGKIVNIASRAALKGGAKSSAYSAAKAAVMRITESMSAELKQYGINVNCIIPGTMDTPQNRKDMPDADTNKWVTPDAIANAILFLLSNKADDIHGIALPVYGLT